MTATTPTTLRHSGSEIRDALALYAPSELASFEADFHAAVSEASTSFDTDPLRGVLDHWWLIAASRSISLTETELDQVRRAQAGDYSGLWERTDDGSFRRID